VADPQRLLLSEPVSHNTVECETREGQLIGTDELPPVRSLDGEVKIMGGPPYGGGTYCEVWKGRWRKRSQGLVGRDVGGETVSLSLTTSVSLTGLLVGGIESASRSQSQHTIRDVQGSTFVDQLRVIRLCISAVIRRSDLNFEVGQDCVIKTSCRSMVRPFHRFFPWKVPTVVQE